MTGFESWVKMGLELGSDFLLETMFQVAEESGLTEITAAEKESLVKETAKRVMDRWPPWKAENTRQVELPYPCDMCRKIVEMRSTRTTAAGRVCISCLDSMVKGVFP